MTDLFFASSFKVIQYWLDYPDQGVNYIHAKIIIIVFHVFKICFNGCVQFK